MGFEEVDRKPLYLQVAEQIREAILRGDLAPGSRLPTERALGETFGVSRASVREALRSLQAHGLISGAGRIAPARTVVTLGELDSLQEAVVRLLTLQRVPFADLVELRTAVEAAAVRRAAERAGGVPAEERLAEARLVSLGEDSVEVTHEALIREWPTLRSWLAEDREGLRIHRRLTQGAREWEALGREAGVLYKGVQLATARDWAGGHQGRLNDLERAFLVASGKQEQDELAAAGRQEPCLLASRWQRGGHGESPFQERDIGREQDGSRYQVVCQRRNVTVGACRHVLVPRSDLVGRAQRPEQREPKGAANEHVHRDQDRSLEAQGRRRSEFIL